MAKRFEVSHITAAFLTRLSNSVAQREGGVAVSRYFHREDGELAVAIACVDVFNDDGQRKVYGAAVGPCGGGCFDDARFIVMPSGRTKVRSMEPYPPISAADTLVLDAVSTFLGEFYEWDDSTDCMPVFHRSIVRAMKTFHGKSGRRLIDRNFDAARLRQVERRWSIGYQFLDNV